MTDFYQKFEGTDGVYGVTRDTFDECVDWFKESNLDFMNIYLREYERTNNANVWAGRETFITQLRK